jgi:hypothetical protein
VVRVRVVELELGGTQGGRRGNKNYLYLLPL